MYAIAEVEANQDGYTTSSSGETGAILKDETAKAVFLNHKESVASDTQVSVKKIWKLDDGGTAAGSVTVALLRNGAEYSVVTLDEGNGWSHTWSGLDPQYSWTVQEIDVPNGFGASVDRVSDNHFRITNDDLPNGSLDIPEDSNTTNAPPTGDASGHGLWLMLLLLSGTGFIGFMVYGTIKRKV